MSVLRDFERRLEGAVEGFFARAFRSGLQPVELAKAIQRYASNYQNVGVDGVFVPNVYRFELNPADHERFREFGESLANELSDVLVRTANERGWQLRGPARIELAVDDNVPMGTYELRGKVEASASGAPRSSAAASEVHSSDGPRATLELVDQAGHQIPLPNQAVVGRMPGCDVQLDDPSVSRRHARISKATQGWLIEDLGSTNGIMVNGASVDREYLKGGEDIELGNVRLRFVAGS
jgi:predicted component of type VI protein secretion system